LSEESICIVFIEGHNNELFRGSLGFNFPRSEKLPLVHEKAMGLAPLAKEMQTNITKSLTSTLAALRASK
jgi:hypothetical protein